VSDDYHAWIAYESASAKSLRHALIVDHGASPKWVRASGCWRRGAAGVHDSFDE
jgi:NADPH-dependent ferric siderophore reductase